MLSRRILRGKFRLFNNKFKKIVTAIYKRRSGKRRRRLKNTPQMHRINKLKSFRKFRLFIKSSKFSKLTKFGKFNKFNKFGRFNMYLRKESRKYWKISKEKKKKSYKGGYVKIRKRNFLKLIKNGKYGLFSKINKFSRSYKFKRVVIGNSGRRSVINLKKNKKYYYKKKKTLAYSNFNFFYNKKKN